MPRRLAVALALAAATGAAHAQPPPGTPVVIASVPGLAGGAEELLPKDARAGVVIFFRPAHERSMDALREVARCQARLAGKPVRWLGVVPGDADAAAVKADVASAGIALAIARDEGDRLYGELTLRMHPVVLILEKGRKLSSVVPFQAIDYCEVLTVRIRRALGEATDADVAAVLSPKPSELPGDGDPQLVSHRNVNFARKLLEARSYASAHAQVQKALGVAPSAEAWLVEGEIFRAERRCDDARRAFATALKLDPKHAGALAASAQPCP